MRMLIIQSLGKWWKTEKDVCCINQRVLIDLGAETIVHASRKFGEYKERHIVNPFSEFLTDGQCIFQRKLKANTIMLNLFKYKKDSIRFLAGND